MKQTDKTVPDPFSWLRLIRAEGVGPVMFAKLVDEFGSVTEALQAMPTLRRRGKPLLPASEIAVKKEYDGLLKMGGHWLLSDHPPYPQQLRAIDDAPPVLSALGDTTLLEKPIVGIVGARNASLNGRRLAASIARELGQAGYVIASGLARGIDAAVHEAALETGTIGVVANGVDIVYPPDNKNLRDSIASKGLILSENALGLEPSSSLFPRRNRIISGLSQAVVVIEAAAKSGSLITARFALDQGRDVFAVPGHPFDPRASGPNSMIKSGAAQLIESAQDVLDALGGLSSLDTSRPLLSFALDQVEAYTEKPETSSFTDDQARQIVLTYLSPTPCAIDSLTQATALPTQKVLAILMELELTGQIQRVAGNRVVRV